MIVACRSDSNAERSHGGLVDATNLPGAIWPLDLVSHLHEHLVWMRLQGRVEDTLFARRRACVRLAEWLRHDPITATYDELYAWQLMLLRTSLVLVRHQTALVRPYFKWLLDAGRRSDNPAALLPLPKAKRGLPRPIPEPRLAALLVEARPRLVPWLLLAGWSGLRAAEIAHLRVDDFFVDDRGCWVLVHGKGGTLRNVPIPEWAWPTIAAALAGSGPAWRRERGFGPVTPQHVSQLCNQLLHSLGFPDTLHSLRHRVGTLTYEQTRDIRLVQDLLGHAHMSTTAIYTRVSPGHVAQAVAQLPQPPATDSWRLRALPRAAEGTA